MTGSGYQMARAAAMPRAADLIQIARIGERSFVNRVTTLVALLVVNGRKEEAQRVVEQAKQGWPDAGFRAMLEDALKGHVPEPFPTIGF